MYDVGTSLPVDALDDGDNVLCHGPALSGKAAVGFDFLAEGDAQGEGSIAVTARRDARDVRRRFAAATGGSTDRLVVVDCTAGEATPVEDPDDRVRVVSSPADLTGIGIELSDAFQWFDAAGADRIRLFFDSISTLAMYVPFRQVYKFVHTLTQQVDAVDAVGLYTVDTDTVDQDDVDALYGLFDGLLDTRSVGGRVEYRLRTDEQQTSWRARDGGEPTDSAPATADAATTASDALPLPESLHELLESVAAERRTLTLFDPADDGAVADLRSALESYNVDVVTADAPADGPENFAVLHHDGAFVDAISFVELHSAVALTDADAFENVARPRLLSELSDGMYRADAESVAEMVRISREVELTAWQTGGGTLHAGFQRLSRLRDERGTRAVYDALLDADVDVHLYGRPDAAVDDDRFAVHGDDGAELAATWFVLYDGGGASERCWGILAEERDDRTYSGFWTVDERVVGQAMRYLERTY